MSLDRISNNIANWITHPEALQADAERALGRTADYVKYVSGEYFEDIRDVFSATAPEKHVEYSSRDGVFKAISKVAENAGISVLNSVKKMGRKEFVRETLKVAIKAAIIAAVVATVMFFLSGIGAAVALGALTFVGTAFVMHSKGMFDLKHPPYLPKL